MWLGDILAWYDEFNAVRNQFFTERGLMGTGNYRLPASTGIGVGPLDGGAMAADVFGLVGPEGAIDYLLKGGNQNPANLDKARFAFEDLLQRYPNSNRSADARARIAEIQNRNIQRNFDIAEFYFKKGQLTSATFYYEEVRRESSGGPLHQKATARLAQINGQ